MAGDSFGKRIRGRDVALLVISLLLASAIWLFHNLSNNYTEQISVRVIAHCSLDGHAYSSSSPSLLHARCRASGFSLILLKRRAEHAPVEVVFDPEDLHPKGGELFYITAPELEEYSARLFKEGTRVELFLTDTLFFRFPFEASRRVPVVARLKLSYKSQFMAASLPVFSPDSITIFGDPGVISRIEKVNTMLVDRKNIDSPVSGSVKLESIAGVRLSRETIDYEVDVARFVEIPTEARVSVTNVPAGRSVVVYPSVARMTLRCRFPVVSAENLEPVALQIDYQDFKKTGGGRCLPVAVNLPTGTINYSVEPETFDCVEISL